MHHKRLFQLFVLFLPTQLSLHVWPDFSYVYGIAVDYLAPALYFADFLFLLFFGSWIAGRDVGKRVSKHKTLILVIFGVMLVNIAFSLIPALSAYRWLRLWQGVFLYVYVKETDGWRLAIKPLSISLVFTLGLAVFQLVRGSSAGGFLYWVGERAMSRNTPGVSTMSFLGREVLRPYATFSHPNSMAGFALVSFFALLGQKGRLVTVGRLSALFLIGIAFSQNAWMGLLGAPVIYFMMRKLSLSFRWFLVGASLVSLLFSLFPFSDVFLAKELTERLMLNATSGSILSAYPVFGAGLGTFAALVPFYYPGFSPVWILQPVHNIFLLVSAELGVFALGGFWYFIFKNINKANAISIIAIVLTGMFDHYWLTLIQNVLLFAMVLGYNEGHENLL